MRKQSLISVVLLVSMLLSLTFFSLAFASAPPEAAQTDQPEQEEFPAESGETAEISALSLGGDVSGHVPAINLVSPLGMAFTYETEPNDSAATANALSGTQVMYGTISPAADVDYFSFTAVAGDRVFAATMTQFSNGGSTDTVVDIIASDGTTVLESDDDNGTFSASSSAIGGTIIPTDGTYYVRVDGFSTSLLITPYHLHVRVQSGTPTTEVEPNNDLASATPLSPSGWMSGTVTATTDPDIFSFSLNAGDSVYIGLDMDPDRNPANTNWNGRVGLGVLNGFFLLANDGSTVKPHAEAFFMTVQETGTYYVYIDSTVATGLGPNARYHLNVSVYPQEVQQNCTTFTSTDVPHPIGPGAGTTISTIVVPPTVTSSISDVNASIVLTHTAMLDLDVTLLGPTSVSTPLFTDIGSTTQPAMDIGLDDQAALPIGPFTVVTDIIYQPEQPGRLAAFNGTVAAGTWTLQVADDLTNTSGGVLQGWSLEICGDPPPDYGIQLNKTVGVEPAVCATTDTITVPPGGFDVYYCYTVQNIGLNTLTTHDLVDSELGILLSGVNQSLPPGDTFSFIQQATISATVTNNATWTASDGTGSPSANDTATVIVPQYCPAGYRDVTVDYTFFEGTFPPPGWTVTNTTTSCGPSGVPEWTNTNPGNLLNLTGGLGLFAVADSDACGAGSTLNTIMTTGLLDFSGLVSPTVSFYTDYNDIATGGDMAILDASSDGGVTWYNLFTWDSDNRGPLLVTEALPGAGENDVQVRWHYSQGTFDWWWQVDSAFLTACEPVAIGPAITLEKTVGTDAAVCATTDSITVPGGTEVTYCFTAENTGDVTLNLHDLADSELGPIFTALPYSLAPGASAFITATTTLVTTTVNTATWVAYNVGPSDVVTATDTATVTIGTVDPPNIFVDPLAVSSSQNPDTQTQHTVTISNTGGSDLVWQILEEPVLRSAARPLQPTTLPVYTADVAAEMVGLETGTPLASLRPSPEARAQAKLALFTTGLLLVPDSSNDRVMALDPLTGDVIDADFIPSNAVVGTGIEAILSASGDSILLSDQINDVVHEFDLDGNYLGVFAPVGGPNPAIMDNIRGISLDANGNLLVSVASGANADAIVMFDTAGNYTGNFVAIGAGGLNSPFDVYGRTSDWLVPGIDSDAVHRYDLTGAYIANLTPVNSFPEQVGEAINGNVLVANFSPAAEEGVIEYTSAGVFVGRYDPATLTGYRGVYELPNGNLLTTTGTGVHEIDRSGNLVQTKIAGLSGRFIEYVVIQADCSAPADIPWAAVAPANGTTAAGAATDVTVTLDSTGLAAGDYSGNLCFLSNDPDPGPGNETELVIVPVNLTVLQTQFATIELTKTVGTAPAVCATTSEITVDSGETVYYCYEVSNTGDVPLPLHDLVDDQLGSLFTGFAYNLLPGESVDTVAAGLTISQTIYLTTTNTAVWTAYDGASFTATDTAVATVNVNLPQIDVSPTSLSSTQVANTVSTETLTISNLGDGDLDWTIDEEAPTTLPALPTSVPTGLLANPADAADVADGTDNSSTSVPAPLSNFQLPLGGVLYDNGPLVTHPGGGSGGADASALQTALGMGTYGFGHANTSAFRVADDFTVPTGGWTLDQIIFYAYQTGSPTTSTITGVYLRIWDGPPGDPGSSVVFGDTTTNIMSATTWSNIYRTLDTDVPTATTRPVMANTAELGGLYLPEGTYWLDWQTSGSLASGPWVPPVTVLGSTGTGNAVQFDGAVWVPLVDVGPQDLPFQLIGDVTPSVCATLTDIPWASVSPTSGTTAGGDSSEVMVTFDTTGLTVGSTYTGTLCVNSNDPVTPLVTVPLTLTVAAQSFGVEVAAEDADLSGDAGTTVTYTVWVTNTGNVEDTFDLTATGVWDATPSVASVTLAAGGTTSVMVTVDIPAGVEDGDMDVTTFTATSQSDASATDSVDLTTTAVIVPAYGVEVTAEDADLSGEVGTTVMYMLWITNTGNVQDTFDVIVSGNEWDTAPAVASITLAANAGGSVMVHVDIPATAANGDTDTVTVTVTSQSSAAATDSVVLTTTAVVTDTTIYIYLPVIMKP